MTFWRNYYHVTWATKYREELITEDLEAELFAYIISKAKELGVFIYAINGWSDHVHIVCAIPPKLSVSEVIQKLKGASSYQVNHIIQPEIGGFHWQHGYGCLSVGEKQRPIAVAYVENQKKHHTENTTNTWLEAAAEYDEGPTDVGIGAEEKNIKENQAAYATINDPYPF